MASLITAKDFAADFAVGRDVIRAVEVTLIDFRAWHEAVDVDRMSALDLDGFELFLVDFDEPAFADLVAPPFVFPVDDLAGLLIDHLLPQPVAGSLVDLVEVGFLGLSQGGKKLDRASHEGKL
jgi:hypothetical protein